MDFDPLSVHRSALARSCYRRSQPKEELVETRIDEIADGIYRLSTFVPAIAPPAGFTFNESNRNRGMLVVWAGEDG